MVGIGIGASPLIYSGQLQRSLRAWRNYSDTTLTATPASDTAMDLAWTNPNISGVTLKNVVVEISTDGVTFTTSATLGVVTSTQVTGLTAGTLYYFRLAFINSRGIMTGAGIIVIGITVVPTFRSTSRSGDYLVDDYGNNAQILYPVLDNILGDNAASVTDNQDLDVGNTYDLTFGGWIQIDAAPSVAGVLVGKQVSGTIGGKYFFDIETNGLIYIIIRTTGGDFYTQDTIGSIVGTGMRFVTMEIIQASKIVNLRIDGELRATMNYTGTFAAMDSKFKFYLGAGQTNAAVPLPTVRAKANFGDIIFIRRILTVGEYSNCLAHSYPSDSDHIWIPSITKHYDIIGTLHLMKEKAKITYSNHGSKHCLNNGYELFSTINGDECIPFKLNGDSMGLSETSEFFKKYTVLGSSTNHNFADTGILFNGDEWDRSDTDRFNGLARDTVFGYDPTMPKMWQAKLLNNHILRSWSEANFKGINVIYADDYSYKEKNKILKILTFSDNITGDNYNAILADTNDEINGNICENDYVYWEEIADTIIAVRGNKILKYNDNLLQLSVDNGSTYPYSIPVPNNPDYLQMGVICSNGNIAVADHQHVYVSTDNLTSINAITPKDIAGDDFTPTTYDNYLSVKPPIECTIGVKSFIVWGNYSTQASTQRININLWCTDDNFMTLKSIYKAGTTDPGLAARHIHGTYFNPNNNTIWFSTGDGTDECNVIQGEYDSETDSWSFTKIAGDNGTGSATYSNTTWYKITGINFVDSYIYFGCDSDDANKTTVIKCAYSDFTDSSKFTKMIDAKYRGVMCEVIEGFGMWEAIDVANNKMILSSDLAKYFIQELYNIQNRHALYTTVQTVYGKSNDGWVYSAIIKNDEDNSSWYMGNTLRIKIK